MEDHDGSVVLVGRGRGGLRTGDLGDGVRRAALDEYKPAPQWMLLYIAQLMLVAPKPGGIRVVMASQEFFDTMPQASEAEGALMMLADGSDVIIMPESAEPTEHWLDILAHEYAHSLHTPLDRIAHAGTVDHAAYEQALEAHVSLLGGLIQFAASYAKRRLL